MNVRRVGWRAQAHRTGKLLLLTLLVLCLMATGTVVGWNYIFGRVQSDGQAMPITIPVHRGPFLHEIVEGGEVESSSNVEIRCQVQSRNSAGTTILEIVPEGTYVERSDFLVKLDDSALKTELLQQEIVLNNSQSQVIEGQAALDTARLALEEYESGTFQESIEQLESLRFVAEENVRRAQEYLRYSLRLAERGYVSEVQLEADRFAVEKAQKELDVAKTRIKVLNEFTKKKMINQLKATIQTSEARLKSLQNTFKLDEARLKQIQDQIAKCEILAPTSGQVVYAKNNRQNSNSEFVIAEGTQVRERQVIIRLPDSKRMRVVANINEARIDRVREGMIAHVYVDAIPDVELAGVVRSVAEYPIVPWNRNFDHIKQYATDIEIQSPVAGLRSGMTARVAIQVEQLEEALQVPLQAVFEHQGRYYCLLAKQNGKRLEAREVQIGSSNDEFLVIEDGLAPGESVVLSPKDYQQDADFPEPSTVANQSTSSRPRPTGRALPDAGVVLAN